MKKLELKFNCKNTTTISSQKRSESTLVNYRNTEDGGTEHEYLNLGIDLNYYKFLFIDGKSYKIEITEIN